MKRIILMLIIFSATHQALAAKMYQTTVKKEKHALGLKMTEEDRKAMRKMPHKMKYGVEPIPGHADISALVSPPENQGNCGSCWSFALTKALRSAYMLKGVNTERLEFNFLLNNCGPGPEMSGCDGGSFAAAQSFLEGAGPGLDKDNPYKEKVGKCKKLPVEATAVSYEFLGPVNGTPSFRDIAYAIGVEKHMLATDVAASAGDWSNYSGGIYNGCKLGPVDHMINIVGYHCETSVDQDGNCVFDSKGRPLMRDGYLILQNNWGEHWGVKAANGKGGYMKTRMYDSHNRHCNRVATDALYFNVNPPASKTVDKPKESCTRFLCSWSCSLPWCDR
jgi:hypothetical protein